MADRRRYTATPRPQLAWTALALAVLVLAGVGAGPVAVVAVVAGWLLGLVAVGLRERRQWAALTAGSGFERAGGVGESDLRRVVDGRSVTVTADLVGPLAGSHTTVGASVEGVEASFTVVATTEADDSRGRVHTGHGAFDERFVVRGSEPNVAAVLADPVREALLALALPGTLTVTDRRVRFEVPFTGLTPGELDEAAALVADVAARVEAADG